MGLHNPKRQQTEKRKQITSLCSRSQTDAENRTNYITPTHNVANTMAGYNSTCCMGDSMQHCCVCKSRNRWCTKRVWRVAGRYQTCAPPHGQPESEETRLLACTGCTATPSFQRGACKLPCHTGCETTTALSNKLPVVKNLITFVNKKKAGGFAKTHCKLMTQQRHCQDNYGR